MNRVIRALIVDDEPIARRILREELALFDNIELTGEADNGRDALRQIVDLKPDLVFLDLQMPEMNGFDVVRNLHGTHLPIIVIVTAFAEHAIEAFEAGAVDYLLKPIRTERLEGSVERARKLLGKPREIARNLATISEPGTRKIVGRIARDYFLLDHDEILALQADGELVWIITEKRRYLATHALRTMEAMLPQPGFQRVHRNAIVNTNHVRQMTSITSHRWILTLSNNQDFVVSKRQAHNIRRLLHR